MTYNKFLSGALKDLIHRDLPPVQRDSVDSEAVHRSAALKLIRCGELSKAARILTSDGLALSSAETIGKLSSKHLKRFEEPNPMPEFKSSFSLDEEVFRKVI